MPTYRETCKGCKTPLVQDCTSEMRCWVCDDPCPECGDFCGTMFNNTTPKG